jgi:ATP-dependent Clp protease ATP-binding subunit ClpC
MFERYTEKARRVIFFARYEAALVGSPTIETEHLLLGLLREEKALSHQLIRSTEAIERIRKEIDAATEAREKTATSVDLPLSNECKRVLAHAMEEADRLGHKHIGTAHMLLGLLREEECFAAKLLRDRRVTAEKVREQMQQFESGRHNLNEQAASKVGREEIEQIVAERTGLSLELLRQSNAGGSKP